MDLVFFTYAFPPLKFPRSIQVARLAKFSKYPVTVFCGQEAESELNDSSLEQLIPNSLSNVVRTPRRTRSILKDSISSRAPLSWFNLPDVYSEWGVVAASSVECYLGTHPQSILISFGNPMSVHLTSLQIKRKFKCPWIAHFSDPWSDNPFWALPRILRKRVERWELEVVREADAVLFTSPEARELVSGKYGDWALKKSFYLPHCFDSELYPDATRDLSTGKVVFAYFGNFYGSRSPISIYQALETLRSRDPALFSKIRFEIYGHLPKRLSPPDTLKGTVLWKGTVSYLESLRKMQEVSVLVSLDAPLEESVFFPSKFADYLGAKQPILAITPEGTVRNLARKLGVSVADPRDIGCIEVAIQELSNRVLAGTQPLPVEKERLAFGAESVGLKFDQLCERVSATP